MSDLEKNRALSAQRTTAAISLEVEEICARADRICDIVARSEGYSDFKEYKAEPLRERDVLFKERCARLRHAILKAQKIPLAARAVGIKA